MNKKVMNDERYFLRLAFVEFKNHARHMYYTNMILRVTNGISTYDVVGHNGWMDSQVDILVIGYPNGSRSSESTIIIGVPRGILSPFIGIVYVF